MSKRIMNISELDSKSADQPIFGNGIALAGGFDLGAATPLDSRAICNTIAERDAHVTGNRAYEGMTVYVKETKKSYRYIDGAWQSDFNQDDANTNIQNAIVNDLVTGGADKALSAEQGKVLKGLIDNATVEIEANTAAIEAEGLRVDALETAVNTTLPASIEAAKKAAVQEAKEYVDAEIPKAIDGLRTELTTSSDELKTYVDTQDAANLEAAKTYADSSVEGLKNKLVSPATDAELNVKVNDLNVKGNLTVEGQVTSVDKQELHVADTVIELNSGGVDVETSDVHLGIRAKINETDYSELSYCPESNKWVVIDNSSSNAAARETGDHAPAKTIAFVEDIEAAQGDMTDTINAVSTKVDTLETVTIPAVEAKADANAADIAELGTKIEALENAPVEKSEKIATPATVMTLSAEPVDGKVQLNINGLIYEEGFTVQGTTLTWGATDFEIEEDDVIIARYMA